jgi:hypothetical protein
MGGGVFLACDKTTAQEVLFKALQYVAKKLFMSQFALF